VTDTCSWTGIAEELAGFNPAQPRDNHGRWSETGERVHTGHDLWIMQGYSQGITAAAAALTGLEGWDDRYDKNQLSLAESLLDSINRSKIKTTRAWSGHGRNPIYESLAVGDTLDIPLMSTTDTEDLAHAYLEGSLPAPKGNPFPYPGGRTTPSVQAILWEAVPVELRPELRGSIARDAADFDPPNLLVFDSHRSTPIRAAERVTSGRYRVSAVEDGPKLPGTWRWEGDGTDPVQLVEQHARQIRLEYVAPLKIDAALRPAPRVVGPDHPPWEEEFHLRGTADDHDQQTHAGGRGGRLGPKARNERARFAPVKSWASMGDIEDAVTAMVEDLNETRPVGNVMYEYDGVTILPHSADVVIKIMEIDHITGERLGESGAMKRVIPLTPENRKALDDGNGLMLADRLYVDDSWQGHGIGTHLQEGFEDLAAVSGISRVEVSAADVGRWAWARSGYDWADTQPFRAIGHALRFHGHNGLADQFTSATKVADVPTPFELSEAVGRDVMLAGHSQIITPGRFPGWTGIKELKDPLAASAGIPREVRLAAVRDAHAEWAELYPIAADPTDDQAEPGADAALSQMVAARLQNAETFHLRGTADDHDQQTHAGGRRARIGDKVLDDDPDRFRPIDFTDQMSLVESGERFAAEVTREVRKLDGMRNLTLEIEDVYGARDGSKDLLFDFRLVDEHGDYVEGFRFERTVDTRADGEVVSTARYLILPDHLRRRGLGTLLRESWEDQAAASGVERIVMKAANDGRLVWARAGYDFDPDEWHDTGVKLATRLMSAGSPALGNPDNPDLRAVGRRIGANAELHQAGDPISNDMPTPHEAVQIFAMAGIEPGQFMPEWSATKPLRTRPILQEQRERDERQPALFGIQIPASDRETRLAKVRAAWAEWWPVYPAAADGAVDVVAGLAYASLLDKHEAPAVETFHLKGTPFDHDQQSHAGGRVAPISGETVKKTIAVDLTLTGDALTDKVKAKVLAQLRTSLGVTPAEAEAHLIDVAEHALAKGLPGRDWYETAAEEAIDTANGSGIDPEVAVAITAALSPGTPWDQNRRNAHDMMATFANRDQPLDPAHIRNTNVWANRPDKSTGARNSEARATEDDTFNTLYERDPRLAAVYLAKASGASVGYSYDNFFKATDLMVRNDPAAIDGILRGTKVRSFYNNLANPRGTHGDVTVDIHMQRAMANNTASTTAEQKFTRSTSIKKRASAITGSPSQDGASLGAMPVMADVVRNATATFNASHDLNLLPHEFQAIVWVEQISQYPPSRIKQILKGQEL
jgi:GNAT superfamily N-acetyltransferase